MKKLFFLIVLVLLLSSCKDSGTNFKPLDSFTTEEAYMITHADSTILYPAIILPRHVIVIDRDFSKAVKVKDDSGAITSLLLMVCISLIGLVILGIIGTIKT